MANKKITELNEATSVSGNDWLVIVDVANDETKKVHANQVGGNIPIQDTAPQDPEEDDLWIDTSEAEEYNEPIDYYSTNEVKTNKIWINNKPIYRKVVDCGAGPNNTTKNVSSGITGTIFITRIYGFMYIENSSALPLPDVNTSAIQYSIRIAYDIANNNVQLISGADRSGYTCYVILEYTK